jgi:hypothetical protein
MRMQVQLLGPGVQHGEHADGAADVPRIAGQFDDRSGTGLHQHAIAVTLVGAQHLAQFGRHSDSDVEVRNWQQFRLSVFQPFLCLCGVTLGTTAVAAGMIGEHLGLACSAAPDLSAECRGPAVENVLDGTPMRGQHRRAVSRDVVRREATEHVGDLDHDRASEAGHQPIEQTVQRHPGGRGEMGVDGGGGDAGVAEQDLNDTDVDAVLDQPGRVGVSQAMRGYPALDAGRGDSGGEGIRQHALVDGCITVPVGEQPARVAMGPPQIAQRIENRLWQRCQPLLVALADDAQHVVGPVDGADLQRGGLADAQAARIHDGEACLMDRVVDGAEQKPDLIF